MKAYSLDLRQRVLDAYLNGEGSQEHVAQRFSVSRSFVQKMLRLHRSGASIAPKPRGGNHAPKIAEADLPVVAALVEAQPDATLEELCAGFADQALKSVSIATMHRATKRLGYTVKKTLRASEGETEAIAQDRALFTEEIGKIDPDDLIFIDESGVHRAMTRLYARARRGLRAVMTAPVNKGKNVTIIGALGLSGIVAAMTVEAATTGLIFLAFLEQVLCPLLRPGQLVVMDNLSAHKVEGVRALIEATGARLLYLPSYSPYLNPIEQCWSKLKAILRSKQAREPTALDQAITEAIEAVSPVDAHGWFKHWGY